MWPKDIFSEFTQYTDIYDIEVAEFKEGDEKVDKPVVRIRIY